MRVWLYIYVADDGMMIDSEMQGELRELIFLMGSKYF